MINEKELIEKNYVLANGTVCYMYIDDNGFVLRLKDDRGEIIIDASSLVQLNLIVIAPKLRPSDRFVVGTAPKLMLTESPLTDFEKSCNGW